jgi:hypothetical protein
MIRPIGRRDFLHMTAAVSAAAMSGYSLPAAAAEKKATTEESRQVCNGQARPGEGGTGQDLRLPGSRDR